MRQVVWIILGAVNAYFLLQDGKVGGSTDWISVVGLAWCLIGFMTADDAHIGLPMPWWFQWGIGLGLGIGALAVMKGAFILIMAGMLGFVAITMALRHVPSPIEVNQSPHDFIAGVQCAKCGGLWGGTSGQCPNVVKENP